MSIITEAAEIINGERQDQYGNPEDSFALIAEDWSNYLRRRFMKIIPLEPKDVARMMVILKLCRMHGQKANRDNWRDAIGYLAIEADRLNAKD